MFFTRPFSFNPSSIAVVTISFLITLVGYRYLLKSIAGVEDLGVVDSIANRMRYCAAAVVETFRDLVKTTLEAARNVVEAALNAVGRFLARFDSFMDAFSGAIPLVSLLAQELLRYLTPTLVSDNLPHHPTNYHSANCYPNDCHPTRYIVPVTRKL